MGLNGAHKGLTGANTPRLNLSVEYVSNEVYIE